MIHGYYDLGFQLFKLGYQIIRVTPSSVSVVDRPITFLNESFFLDLDSEPLTMLCTLINVLLVLLASRVEGTKDLQGGTAQKFNEYSNDQIERFLMEDDKNWDRSRHCDWLMVTPNPQLVVKGQ